MVDESNIGDSARAYAINVLVTGLPRGHDDDIMNGATADMVIDAYLGNTVWNMPSV